MKVISIVSRLPPSIDGVGDSALSLANSLYEVFGVLTHFLVCDPLWEGESQINQFPIHALKQQTPIELSQILQTLSCDSSTVLLHFSGYGYAKWAVCDWLVEGLQVWKQAQPNCQLVIMFHESYNCMGWPWQHNFWVAHSQKRIARQLVMLADRCITNCQPYALDLTALSGGKHQNIPYFPVVSNIGEPQELKPLRDRSPHLVIFGQAGNRAALYRRSMPQIDRLCHQLEIDQIIDIGNPTGLKLGQLAQTPIRETGKLSAPEISQILNNSMLGLLRYDTLRLGKSGVFAAYAAHGVVPIVESIQKRSHNSSVTGILLSPEEVLSDRRINSADPIFQKVANQAWSNYQSSCQSQQVKTFASLLGISGEKLPITVMPNQSLVATVDDPPKSLLTRGTLN
jgi:hypothetical protein